jgi:hypothetical protein
MPEFELLLHVCLPPRAAAQKLEGLGCAVSEAQVAAMNTFIQICWQGRCSWEQLDSRQASLVTDLYVQSVHLSPYLSRCYDNGGMNR